MLCFCLIFVLGIELFIFFFFKKIYMVAFFYKEFNDLVFLFFYVIFIFNLYSKIVILIMFL